MDSITLGPIDCHCIIGTLDYERKNKQKIICHLILEIDSKAAAKSDNLTDTVDYSVVTQTVKQFIQESQYLLIETLANKTAELLLNSKKILGCSIILEKPDAFKNNINVKIQINRKQKKQFN